MIPDSVRVPEARRASASSSTPSTSSTAGATPRVRAACLRRPPRPGADVVCFCDTNGGSAAADRRGRSCATVAAALAGSPLGIHATTTASCAVANSLVAVEAGAVQVQGTINGFGERCGNANLVSHHPDAAAQDGLRLRHRRAARAPHRVSHFVDELANAARGASALRRALGVRPQGRPARRRPCARRRRPTSTSIPSAGRQRAARAGLRAVRARQRACTRRRSSASQLEGDDRRSPSVLDAPQGARARGLPVRGRRRVVRAADAQASSRRTSRFFEPRGFRVIVEKREDGHTVAEATVKVHVGDERIISTAPRATARSTRSTGAAQGPRRQVPDLADIELVNYKVRVLDGPRAPAPVTRVLHRRQRRRATAGAPSACARTSSRPAGRRWSTPSSSACCATPNPDRSAGFGRRLPGATTRPPPAGASVPRRRPPSRPWRRLPPASVS